VGYIDFTEVVSEGGGGDEKKQREEGANK